MKLLNALPLARQTYDVDLTTAAPVKGPLKNPEGPINIQDHGNPVFFRNIWIVPVKD